MNVLIVEDERSLAKELLLFLNGQHFICDVARNGREASENLAVNTYDFVLLDLGLPDCDGLEVLKQAKKAGLDSAFIVLTARGAVEDRILGLDHGADDYLPKPFSMLELLSRMNAMMRRKFGVAKNEIPLHAFTIDMQNRKLLYRGKEVVLTRKEFDLLSYLVLHKNRVLTRLQLTEHIWGNILEDISDSNYIDVHVKNIRKKLSLYADTQWLETVRGIGYRINL